MQVNELVGDGGGVARSLAFSPDGRRRASLGQDAAVTVWDTVTGSPVGETFTDEGGTIFKAEFSPDGGLLATAGGNGMVRFWDPATGAPVGPRSSRTQVGCGAWPSVPTASGWHRPGSTGRFACGTWPPSPYIFVLFTGIADPVLDVALQLGRSAASAAAVYANPVRLLPDIASDARDPARRSSATATPPPT